MAKPLKPGDDASAPQRVATRSLQNWITDITRMKTEAKDWNGQAGQATAQAVESTGLDKSAITLTASLHRKEPAKRTTIVADIISAFTEMGWINEKTLFGTPAEQAQEKAAPTKKPTGATGTDIQKALDAQDEKERAARQRADDAKAFEPPVPAVH